MTCIVGIVKKGQVTIGGDSAGVEGYDVTIRKDAKVFRIGEFIFGCTSSFRMIQIIRFSFKPPVLKKGRDIFEYMCTDFVNELRKCLKDGGFARKDSEVESAGCFLVGYKNRLFSIESDYQVGEPVDGRASVGCGSSFALGALDVLDGLPEEIVKSALKVSTKRSAGVRPPFILLST